MMTTMRRMAPIVSVTSLVVSAVLLGACKKKEAPVDTAPTVQTIGPDNIAVTTTDTLRSGPSLSGNLVAEREARIRAEVAGSVLQTYVEAGQRVAAGATLARIESAILDGQATGARSGLAQATVSADRKSVV